MTTAEVVRSETEKRYAHVLAELKACEERKGDVIIGRFFEGKEVVLKQYKEYLEIMLKALNQ